MALTRVFRRMLPEAFKMFKTLSLNNANVNSTLFDLQLIIFETHRTIN